MEKDIKTQDALRRKEMLDRDGINNLLCDMDRGEINRLVERLYFVAHELGFAYRFGFNKFEKHETVGYENELAWERFMFRGDDAYKALFAALKSMEDDAAAQPDKTFVVEARHIVDVTYKVKAKNHQDATNRLCDIALFADHGSGMCGVDENAAYANGIELVDSEVYPDPEATTMGRAEHWNVWEEEGEGS